MTKRFLIFFSILSVSLQGLASAQMSSPQAQMQMCQSSSIWLQSDACWGQTSSYFPSGNNYQMINGDPFSDIASLMRGLRGQQFPSSAGDAFAGAYGAQPNLWDNSGILGNGNWGGSNLSIQQLMNALPRTQ